MGLKEDSILYILIVRHNNASGLRYICAIAQETFQSNIDVGCPANVPIIDCPSPCIPQSQGHETMPHTENPVDMPHEINPSIGDNKVVA